MNDLLTAKDFVKAGYVGGVFGYDGRLRLDADEEISGELNQNIHHFYFVENGMYVPRFIASWEIEQSLVSFDQYSSREQARSLTDRDVFLRKRDLPDSFIVAENDKMVWDELMGFQIWDVETEVLVGVIDDVAEYPGGWMAEVRSENRLDLIMVPLADPLIREVDQEHKILYMDLPGGLVEL